MLFLDLDDFKIVNDSLGHGAGDSLLIEVARRLGECLRGGDTAARFGGDEFAVLMEEIINADEACEVAKRIIDALREPMTILDREIHVRASIGIAFNRLGTEEPAELIQAADVAMYAAKARGKGRYELYQTVAADGCGGTPRADRRSAAGRGRPASSRCTTSPS